MRSGCTLLPMLGYEGKNIHVDIDVDVAACSNVQSLIISVCSDPRCEMGVAKREGTN